MPRRASKPESSASTSKLSKSSTGGVDLYRRLALALPDAVEASHMGAADFRVNGRIFATLAYQAKGLGTVMLNAEQQAGCLADAAEYFTPAPGAWGWKGTTLVRLDAPENMIAGALSTAHRNVLSRSLKPTRRRSPSA